MLNYNSISKYFERDFYCKFYSVWHFRPTVPANHIPPDLSGEFEIWKQMDNSS